MSMLFKFLNDRHRDQFDRMTRSDLGLSRIHSSRVQFKLWIHPFDIRTFVSICFYIKYKGFNQSLYNVPFFLI
jgi:hypothetical protein